MLAHPRCRQDVDYPLTEVQQDIAHYQPLSLMLQQRQHNKMSWGKVISHLFILVGLAESGIFRPMMAGSKIRARNYSQPWLRVFIRKVAMMFVLGGFLGVLIVKESELPA
jgi:hypothetical protein